jgi:hypothetical protein
VVEKVLALNAEARARGDFQWKVVLNKGDVMQGSGSATFFYKQSTLAKPLAVSEQVRRPYSDAKVANRKLRVWHGATETGP